MSILVQGIRFNQEEAEQFSRALPSGYDNALGVDEKERPLVRRWRTRLTQLQREETEDDGWVKGFTDVFFEDDLVEAGAVLRNLVRRFEPETDPAWWREGAGSTRLATDDAIEGLAKERQIAVSLLTECASLIESALLRITSYEQLVENVVGR